MLVGLLAAIVIGQPGPAHHISFRDASLRATITYRMMPSPYRGEADPGPSVADGTLTIESHGRRRTYDLSTIVPIRQASIFFAEHPPNEGCGIARTLSHRGHYLAIESMITGKGCAPVASFIDVITGEPAEFVVVDHHWAHRFDVQPMHFVGEPYRIDDAERLSIEAARWNPNGQTTIVPWRFVLFHASGSNGRPRLFAYAADGDLSPISPGSDALPTLGSTVAIGLNRAPDRSVLRWFDGERIIFLSDGDEQRFARLQTPTPTHDVRAIKRGEWLDAADDDAFHGHFLDAVEALRTMLTFEDDPGLAAGEREQLRQCDALAAAVRYGNVTERAASALFSNGCDSAAP